MARKDRYYVYVNGKYKLLGLMALRKYIILPNPRSNIWSARLSTGLLGLTTCPSGNSEKAPKGYSEILLAVGDDGLHKLIELGFITCPACHPENADGFWDAIGNVVLKKYCIGSLNEFVDKTILPFDARRVNWEKIIPVIERWPNQLYIPKDVSKNELIQLRKRFEKIITRDFILPPVGYYNPDVPERFTPYQLYGIK